MRESLKDLNDKLNGHDDSLFSINTNVSNLKIGIDDSKSEIESSKRDQDSLLERIEKIETDNILLKDELDQKTKDLDEEVQKIKEGFVTQINFDEKIASFAYKYDAQFKTADENISDLIKRVNTLENNMPPIDGLLSLHTQ